LINNWEGEVGWSLPVCGTGKLGSKHKAVVKNIHAKGLKVRVDKNQVIDDKVILI